MLRHQHEWTEDLFYANLAESAGLYDDMLAKACEMAAKDSLNIHEQNMFAEAVQMSLASTRSGIRNLEQMRQHTHDSKKRTEAEEKACAEYKAHLIADLNRRCDEIIKVVENAMGGAVSHIDHAFCNKMLADLLRYKAEFTPNDDANSSIQKHYAKAEERAEAAGEDGLGLLISVKLNDAVFRHEILKKKSEAVELMEDLEKHVIRSDMADSVAARLVRHNLYLWKHGEHKVYHCRK